MPSVAYGSTAYRRTTGNFPELKLINIFVEKAATSENQVALLSRPGLSALKTNGSGPTNKIYCENGVFNGDDFSISGKALYRGTTLLGTMADVGDGPYSIAGNTNEILIAGGGDMYRWNGTALTKVTFPDSAHVRAVWFIGSVFKAIRGTESDGSPDLYPGRFYWSNVLDGSTWDALNFATAERRADGLLDGAALNDKSILYGQSTIEVWADTGDADLRFTRIEGIGSQSKGIIGTGAHCEADNTFFHIGSDGVVYRLGDQFDRVSDHWLEERIIASTNRALFSFRWQGHEFVCVRLDDETFAYDCATQGWCELQTDGGQWIAQCSAMHGQTAYFGHHSTGQIMIWSGWDDLGTAMERRLTFAVPLDEPASIDRISFWCNTGHTPLLTGQGSDPQLEMRLSDDAGNTWSDWDGDDLGAQGDYRQVPEFRGLGQFDFPGLMGEVRVTDPVGFRLSAVKINDPGGGKSR
jgi:hypothetical protein